MLTLKWFAWTYKSYNRTDDQTKGFTSLRLRIYFDKCGLKDKTSELRHKLEKVLQWKVRKAHHKKVKSEESMGHWKVWFFRCWIYKQAEKMSKTSWSKKKKSMSFAATCVLALLFLFLNSRIIPWNAVFLLNSFRIWIWVHTGRILNTAYYVLHVLKRCSPSPPDANTWYVMNRHLELLSVGFPL